MIVIATNNGKHFLSNLLDDFKKFNIKHPISVIDTQSNDSESINFLKKIKQLYPELNIQVFTTLSKNFDTGAYIFALNNIVAEKYYFLHDSIRIVSPHIFEEIDKKLHPGNVVALTTFKGNTYYSPAQSDFCYQNWGTTEYTTGIFGPMFAILRSDVIKSWNNLPKILPTNKFHQTGMERGWGIFCDKSDLNIVELDETISYSKGLKDGFKYFTKIIIKRT